MIRHIVMLDLAEAAMAPALSDVMIGLDALHPEIDGWMGFEHGPNIDVEGKSSHLSHGFICTFRDRAALDVYALDPRHRALGARLVALCRGGAEGLVVIDLDLA